MCNSYCFPSQQWVGERASVTLYVQYIACLVLITNGQEDICNWWYTIFNILCTVHGIKLLIYIITFTSTEIHTHQTLVNPLHVSARHSCHH